MTTATIKRSIELFRAFRVEKADPDRFYRLLAHDSVQQVATHLNLKDKLVLDVGGGAGYFTNAFHEAGARCVLIEPHLPNGAAIDSFDGQGDAPADQNDNLFPEFGTLATVISDGYQLPFAASTADVCFSSNVLEHVPDPEKFIGELIRVTKPGGIIYVAFTNWYSPWGGHGTSPWHYFGGQWALERFKRVKGYEPINRFGETLFPVHIGPILNWARTFPAVEVVEAAPRYYPEWCNWIVQVPGLREIATWNLMLVMRRREP